MYPYVLYIYVQSAYSVQYNRDIIRPLHDPLHQPT